LEREHRLVMELNICMTMWGLWLYACKGHVFLNCDVVHCLLVAVLKCKL